MVWTPAGAIVFSGKVENGPMVLTGILEIQKLIKGPFALGEKISIADLGVLPFIGRLFALGKAGELRHLSSGRNFIGTDCGPESP